MLTYKHEAFLEEAINGILMQQGEFDLELIIGDDCSPDNSEAIVNKFLINQSTHRRIRYFRHSENIGMMPNFAYCFEKCKGEFIAFCEGDDYWTDKNKLNRQVDFLRKNKKYVLTTSSAYKLENNKLCLFDNKGAAKTFTQYDQLIDNQCITCTVAFRKVIDKIPKWMDSLPIGDYPFFLLLMNHGLGYHDNFISAVYRVHSGGVYSGLDDKSRLLKEIEVFEALKKEKPLNINKNINFKLQYLYYDVYLNHSSGSVNMWFKKIIKSTDFTNSKSIILALKSIFKYLLIQIRLDYKVKVDKK